MSKKFPILIIDDFYENPDKIINFANTLEFKKSKFGNFPGGRTEALHNLDKKLFNYFCAKLFGVFYDFSYQKDLKWNVVSNFYKIEKPNEQDNHTTGWIHKDNQFMMAGLVYLNKDCKNSVGTKFYKKIKETDENLSKYKNDYFLGKIQLKEYLKVKEEYNSCFEETDCIEPVFNRMICYDTSYFHTNADISNLQTDRLTQVFFVDKLEGDNNFKFPLERIRYI